MDSTTFGEIVLLTLIACVIVLAAAREVVLLARWISTVRLRRR